MPFPGHFGARRPHGDEDDDLAAERQVSLDEYGEVEDTEQEGEEVTKKGTKRKRAPPTKGPCSTG